MKFNNLFNSVQTQNSIKKESQYKFRSPIFLTDIHNILQRVSVAVLLLLMMKMAII
jgi:hypothetical protein